MSPRDWSGLAGLSSTPAVRFARLYGQRAMHNLPKEERFLCARA